MEIRNVLQRQRQIAENYRREKVGRVKKRKRKLLATDIRAKNLLVDIFIPVLYYFFFPCLTSLNYIVRFLILLQLWATDLPTVATVARGIRGRRRLKHGLAITGWFYKCKLTLMYKGTKVRQCEE